MTAKPRWLELGEQLLVPILALAQKSLDKPWATGEYDISQIAKLAIFHLAASLDSSLDANEKGRHAVGISLTRQCIEALTLIDVGLQDEAFAVPLLQRWRDGTKSSGELRQELEKKVWPNYGNGLWDEPWSEYFGNLSRAVQPYAHVSRELLEWQWAVIESDLRDQKFTVVIGRYDPLKASRITLLCVLVGWTLGRLLLANRSGSELNVISLEIQELGRELGRSKLLMKKKDWWLELLPNMFFKEGIDWRDE